NGYREDTSLLHRRAAARSGLAPARRRRAARDTGPGPGIRAVGRGAAVRRADDGIGRLAVARPASRWMTSKGARGRSDFFEPVRGWRVWRRGTKRYVSNGPLDAAAPAVRPDATFAEHEHAAPDY